MIGKYRSFPGGYTMKDNLKKIIRVFVLEEIKMAHELHELPRIEANSNEKFLRGVKRWKGRRWEDRKVGKMDF